MNKAYSRIYWKNKPSEESPLNAQNLNKIDAAVDMIDDRILTIDATKLEKVEAQTLIKSITFNRANGIFTITYFNNTTATIDTMLEKLMVNFSYDYQAQQLVITLDDGTKQYVDLSALITQYEFIGSTTIAFILEEDGKVSAKVKEGSIEEKHLRPDYLADIKLESARAQSASVAAAESKEKAAENAIAAESFAHGGTGTRPGEDIDNARYWSEQAKLIAGVDIATVKTAGLVKPDGTTIKIASDGTISSLIDKELSSDSQNPVQNRAVVAALQSVSSEIERLQIWISEVERTVLLFDAMKAHIILDEEYEEPEIVEPDMH